MPMLFKSLAELLEKIEATRKRLQMISMVAVFLKALETAEVEPAVSMILGRPFPKWNQENLDVSWATLSTLLRHITRVDWSVFTETFGTTGDIGSAAKALFAKAKVKRQTMLVQKQLTIMEVRSTLEAVAAASGVGSREKKQRLIESLFSQAEPGEAKYLVKILVGEMRTGFSEGLMEQAVAKAFDIPLIAVQQASMRLGDIGETAALAKTSKEDLSNLDLRVFRPVMLMLAQVAGNVNEALNAHGGRTAFEYKYDGARVQIHKLGETVKIFSRRLTDVTLSLPEVVETVRNNITAYELVLEGEVIAVDASGYPIPFQHLMRRFKRIHGIESTAERIPLKLYLFDILHLNGKNLTSSHYLTRRQILAEKAGKIQLTQQLVTDSPEPANMLLHEAVNAGHEGLMAKRLDSPYTPGKRGKNWLKIKTVLEPLDLVITAAEYGYGRRHGWLSDYYLAARDSVTGEFLELGKTFKGLTDAEIQEMTRRLKTFAISEDRWRVIVQPKIVVEVAYNEIQESQTYKSRMALRFARITRVREDKAPVDVDTIQRVREIYEKQFSKKGRYKA